MKNQEELAEFVVSRMPWKANDYFKEKRSKSMKATAE